MTGPGYRATDLPPNPRLLHTALLAGALFGLPLAYALRWIAPVVTFTSVATVLRTIAFAFLLLQAIVVRIIRGKIGPRDPDESEEDWWARYTMPAVLIWCTGAALCAVGAGIHFVTGDRLLLFVGAGGIVLLVLARPSRLMRG